MADDQQSRADRLRSFLMTRGVSADEVAAAVNERGIEELALEHAFVGTGPRFSHEEAAERAGVSIEFANRFWRALGLPEVPPGEPVFGEEDLAALRILKQRLGEGFAEDLALQLTRIVGSSMARIAEAEISAIQSSFSAIRPADDGPTDLSPEVISRIAEVATARVNEQSRLLDYAHRRHLAQAARRQILWQEGTRAGLQTAAVGFADLVGFTALSQQLTAHELAEVVEWFETLAYETVDSLGGRIVKMIGDEVMFVDDDPGDAVEIGLRLAERYESDEALSDVRVGVAWGDVLARDADYYGPVVNLASRIVGIAFPGTVVASAEVHDQVADDDRFEWRPLRPRRLKGIGRADLWTVRRPGSEGRWPARLDRIQARRQQVGGIISDGL